MMLYDATVGKDLNPNMGQAMANAPSSGQAIPGYVITIEGRTPNEGASAFVNSTLIARLNQMGRKDPKPDGTAAGAAREADWDIYFDKVHLVSCRKVSANRDGATPAGGGGFPAAGFGGAFNATQVDETKDPVTGEPMLNDSVFEIKFVAVVNDKPGSAPPPAPSGPEAGL
jgi:hypothetical protein